MKRRNGFLFCVGYRMGLEKYIQIKKRRVEPFFILTHT